jgi:hypothetical protein
MGRHFKEFIQFFVGKIFTIGTVLDLSFSATGSDLTDMAITKNTFRL